MTRRLLLSVLLHPCSALLAQGFEPAVVLPMPSGLGEPLDTALADLDRNGTLDLIALGVGQLAIVPSVGSASPLPATLLPLVGAALANSVQVIDSNGDGLLDLWVGHLLGVQEYRGDGLGGFAAPVRYATVGAAFRLGDLDSDGVPDLVANANSGLAVRRGLGDGTFAPAEIFPAPESQYSWMGLGDVDGDGDLDVVAMIGFGATVRTYLGDGAGTLTRIEPTFPAGGFLSNRCLLTDFDGDGRSDLVTLGQVCALRLAIGGGAFGAPRALAGNAVACAAADLDGDRDVDLVRVVAAGLLVDPGDGAGGLAPSFGIATPQVGAVVAAGDVDADGDVDLVSSNAGFVQVLHGAQSTLQGIAPFGSGTASCAGRIGVAAASRPAVGAADFAVRCTNVLPRTSGLLAIGTPVHAGWDPLGIGLVLHLGLALPVATATTDGAGTAVFALPIPDRPFLAGLRLTAQSVWFEETANGLACSAADYPVASSRALAITLQR